MEVVMEKLNYRADEISDLLKIKWAILNWWITKKREIYPYQARVGKCPALTHANLIAYLNRELG